MTTPAVLSITKMQMLQFSALFILCLDLQQHQLQCKGQVWQLFSEQGQLTCLSKEVEPI